MNKYEVIIVIDATVGEEAIKATVEKFKTLIESHGEIESIDEWGVRRLAYQINYKTEGFYALVTFSAPPQFPQELERVLKITDGILTFLVIRKDAE